MPQTFAAFLYLNGKPISRNDKRSAPDFLRDAPRGVYTGLTIEGLANVLDWKQHVQRLNRSFIGLPQKDPTSFPYLQHPFLYSKDLEKRIGNALRNGIEDMKSMSNSDGDQMVVILLTPSNSSENTACDIYIYIHNMIDRRIFAKPIHVWVQGRGRPMADVKHSKWVTDRMVIEAAKPKNCKEVILVNGKGGLLEGLVSSFYVIRDFGNQFELQTAGLDDGILEGTFRKIILDTIRDGSVKLGVNETCPNLKEFKTWKEAFVSNSLTGIRPISKIMLSNLDIDLDGSESFPNELSFKAPGTFTKILMESTESKRERTPISNI